MFQALGLLPPSLTKQPHQFSQQPLIKTHLKVRTFIKIPSKWSQIRNSNDNQWPQGYKQFPSGALLVNRGLQPGNWVKPVLGVRRSRKTKYPPYVGDTVNLGVTCKTVKKGQVAVHGSKDRNNPKRILRGNHQHHATMLHTSRLKPSTVWPGEQWKDEYNTRGTDGYWKVLCICSFNGIQSEPVFIVIIATGV